MKTSAGLAAIAVMIAALTGVCLTVGSVGAFETGRDDQFISYNNGTVLDTKTKLMWADRDNGKDVSLAEAQSYCRDYRGGAYTDWRMPTLDEIATLYNKNKSYRSDCGEIHITRLIRISCDLVLASDTRASKTNVASFDFARGKPEWLDRSTSLFQRALPVRSAK